MITVFVKNILPSTMTIPVPLTSLRIWFNILELNIYRFDITSLGSLSKMGTLTLEFIHTDDQKIDLFTKTFDSKWFEFLRQNIGVIPMDWSLLLLFLPYAFAYSFIHCFVLFNMFLFIYFSVLLYFVFHKNKKNWKIRKIQKQCVFVYIGTCVPWMAIETKFSKLCIFCSLVVHRDAHLSKWALWLMFVMNKVKESLVLNTRITLFDGKD